MAFQAHVLRVMIASPGDVADERKVITNEIYRWNDAHSVSRKLMLQPVKWETHSTPQLGTPPQTILNHQILDDADILIGVFGTRIGTPTEAYISGTVEEIKRHVAARKTAKVYFSDVPVQPSQIDAEQYRLLQAFKEECRAGGLYSSYKSLDEFKDAFRQHLAIELNHPQYIWISEPDLRTNAAGRPLSKNAKRAVIAADEKDGEIVHSSDMGGENVQFGAEVFTDGTTRGAANWKEVLRELESSELIESVGYDSGIYRLTASGFRAADVFREEEENNKQLEIEMRMVGTPTSQILEVTSNKSIRLRQIEFLTTSGVSTAQEDLNIEGKSANVAIDHNKVVKLFNAPRSDRNFSDHSGPALLRLTCARGDKTQAIDLPMMLQPVFVNSGSVSTQYIKLTGQKRFYL